MNVVTAFAIQTADPNVTAEALREFAGRIERGEVAPGMEGTSEEQCNLCGGSAKIVWSIDIEDDAEDDTTQVFSVAPGEQVFGQEGIPPELAAIFSAIGLRSTNLS